jgi:hypothetical protein
MTDLFQFAIAEEKKALVKVILEKDGVRIKSEKDLFAGPYVVQSGDTLQSISQKFYKTPKYAEFLAKTNKLPEDIALSTGGSILVPVTDFSLKFKPERLQQQAERVRSFVNAAGNENLFEYTWTEIDVEFSIEGGRMIYTKFNPKNLELTAPNNKSLKLTLSFIQQPLLQIFEGYTKIEEVKILVN